MNKARILVIDDDPMMLDLAKYQLQSRGYEVTVAATGEEGLKLETDRHSDIVLTDLQLPDIDGIELVRKLKEVSPGAEIIMITGYGSVNDAIEATRAGAFHFIEKPVEYEALFALIERALERRHHLIELYNLRNELVRPDRYFNIIGSSKAMQNIYEIIERVGESDANIMIIGESGTGKELIANALHYKSLRAKKPFVKINCSALPKELIESELFGHTKGAFTGATTDKIGLIGQATGGSLLLDEIGEMPVELQPKLLRVLQERVYYRLGSEKANEADFRLISATNRNPLDSVREGLLREDLYYRINTIEIHVPPLRERAEDVQHLAEHFLSFYAEKYHRQVHAISQAAYQRMFDYSWPGNVRELQNVIERAVLLSQGKVIEENAIPNLQAAVRPVAVAAAPLSSAGTRPPSVPPTAPAGASVPAQEMTLEQIARLIVNRMPDPKSGGPRVDIFTQLEGAIVSAALERTRGNKQAAANLLGLYRPRLYSMLRKHNLHDTIREADYAASHHRTPPSGDGSGAAPLPHDHAEEEPETAKDTALERSSSGLEQPVRRPFGSAPFHG